MIRRLVAGLLGRQGWADAVGAGLVRVYGAILRPRVLKDFLHGTWLGHALHPALTDVPVGAFTVALFLDVLGGLGNGAAYEGARWATAIGVAGMIAAALAGIADYVDTEGRTRRYGTVHQLLMYLALVAYLYSLAVRFAWLGGSSASWTIAAAVGYLALIAGAYVGGEMVFGHGSMVDRHAWRAGGRKWTALDRAEFPENEPVRAKAGANALLVVRRADQLFVLHDTCSHAGCDLSHGGRLVGDGEIECPCHGSRFRLRDGRVTRGPATFDQPVYEVRRTDAAIEVRRRS